MIKGVLTAKPPLHIKKSTKILINLLHIYAENDIEKESVFRIYLNCGINFEKNLLFA